MSPDEKAARLIDAASALLAAAPKQQLNTLSLNKGLLAHDSGMVEGACRPSFGVM